MSKPFLAHWRPISLSFILFAVNVYICRELFGIEFLNNLSSNDGAFISLARFFQQHGTGNAWFPWFNAGLPIEEAYPPLVPAQPGPSSLAPARARTARAGRSLHRLAHSPRLPLARCGVLVSRSRDSLLV